MYNNTTVLRNNFSNPLNELLMEANNSFIEEHNFNPISGFGEIVADNSLFEDYKQNLCEGLDANDIPVFNQLLDNQREALMSEALTAQIAPIAGLGMSTIRAMWPRTAIKDIFPTEVATTPAFSISWQAPYIRTGDGKKHYLPRSIMENQSLVDKPPVCGDFIALPLDLTSGNAKVTIAEGPNAGTLKDIKALNPDAVQNDLLSLTMVDDRWCNVRDHDSVDVNIIVNAVKMEVPDAVGSTTTEEVVVPCFIKRDIQGNFRGDVSVVGPDGNTYTDTLLGTIDTETGIFKMASVSGLITAFKFRGWISQEANTHSVSVSFDIKRTEIQIGTGAHYNVPMPIEWLKDLKALYNLDGTVEAIDLVSRTIAQRLDQEGDGFIRQSFLDMGKPFVIRYDCKPALGFAGTPTEWRDELRRSVKWLCQKMKTVSYYEDGYFVLYGNTLDVEIIPDVSWTFRTDGGTDNSSGVPNTYNFGVLTGNHRIRIVSSDVVEDGYLRLIWIPTREDQMTYKYYPYTFNIEKGYRDPNMEFVPSIMVTKRHVFAEAVPIQANIIVDNNTGDSFTSYAQ